jgi:hypothetical protein
MGIAGPVRVETGVAQFSGEKEGAPATDAEME